MVDVGNELSEMKKAKAKLKNECLILLLFEFK